MATSEEVRTSHALRRLGAQDEDTLRQNVQQGNKFLLLASVLIWSGDDDLAGSLRQATAGKDALRRGIDYAMLQRDIQGSSSRIRLLFCLWLQILLLKDVSDAEDEKELLQQNEKAMLKEIEWHAQNVMWNFSWQQTDHLAIHRRFLQSLGSPTTVPHQKASMEGCVEYDEWQKDARSVLSRSSLLESESLGDDDAELLKAGWELIWNPVPVKFTVT